MTSIKTFYLHATLNFSNQILFQTKHSMVIKSEEEYKFLVFLSLQQLKFSRVTMSMVFLSTTAIRWWIFSTFAKRTIWKPCQFLRVTGHWITTWRKYGGSMEKILLSRFTIILTDGSRRRSCTNIFRMETFLHSVDPNSIELLCRALSWSCHKP